MARDPMAARPVFLSTLPAGPNERRLALIVALISIVAFVSTAPFAKVTLPKIWGFIPIYQATLVINDLITSVMLFGLYRIVRTRALLVLASGYFFTGFIVNFHTLSFPGLFSETGLLGAGKQTTAWLYMFWHGVFPLVIIAYAFLKDDTRDPPPSQESAFVPIASSIALVAAFVIGIVLLVTKGHDWFPVLLDSGHFTPMLYGVVSLIWGLTLLALIVLWRRPPHSVLDIWLMVVMCVWLGDIGLGALLNAARFDLGFYAGRVYGVLAASFVLAVLLFEHLRLYANLAETHRREHDKSEELAAANLELEAFSYSVSHDLRAPLRAMDGYAAILSDDYGPKLDDEGRRLLGVVRANAKRMGQLIDDLLAFSRLGRQSLKTQRVPLKELVNETIDELRIDSKGRRIDFIVGDLGPVSADRMLLKQVLCNLLGNAIKFTRDKNAVIEVGSAYRDGASAFYVKDNGAGFDMRYADKLFGVFQRLHEADKYEGTGVGLAIVQRVIHRHGGKVWAEAKPGEGATFYFTLTPAS